MKLLTCLLLLLLPQIVVAQTFSDELNKIDSSEWRVDLPSSASGIQVVGSTVRLSNRAYLSPSTSANGDVAVEFDWLWLEDPKLVKAAKAKPELRRQYTDNLMVVLYSDGSIKESRSWEPSNGLKLVVNTGYGEVSLVRDDGETSKKLGEVYISTKDGQVFLEKSTGPNPAIDPNCWYRVHVSQKRGMMNVSLQRIDEKSRKTQVLQVRSVEALAHSRILICNRETNAGATMRSEVRNVQVSTP